MENDVNLICEETKPLKFRNWLILLYEDSNIYDFKEVLRIIKAQKYYAYIEHKPESNEKKAHYHVILSFENATKKSTLSKKLGIPENYIDPIKNFRSICRYLIHKDDEEKIQYKLENVVVSRCFERKYYKCFDDLETDEDIMYNIYNYIDKLKNNEFNYYDNLRHLIIYINAHCYDTIYKRYRNEFIEYLKMG